MGFWVSKTPPTQSMRAWELLREPLRHALRSSSSAVWATDTHLSTRPPSLNGGNIPVLDSAYLDPQTILKTGLCAQTMGCSCLFMHIGSGSGGQGHGGALRNPFHGLNPSRVHGHL